MRSEGDAFGPLCRPYGPSLFHVSALPRGCRYRKEGCVLISASNPFVASFARESNRIEGIAETTDAHIAAHIRFLEGPVHIPALIELVGVLQPNARFRNSPSVPGVRVGNHIAPPSGPDIEGNLRSILAMRDPWEQHIAYETLHPFTDGNGRSGRAIWLHRHWHEELDHGAVRRGFLHSWYYHTLSSVRFASVGRNAKRQDHEDGLGPKDEHAVDAEGSETPKHPLKPTNRNVGRQ